MDILDKYHYKAITVWLTGDYKEIYRRFKERNTSPERHRGHVINVCYPETESTKGVIPEPMSLEEFIRGFTGRGMHSFQMDGLLIEVDTTDFTKVDVEEIVKRIKAYVQN